MAEEIVDEVYRKKKGVMSREKEEWKMTKDEFIEDYINHELELHKRTLRIHRPKSKMYQEAKRLIPYYENLLKNKRYKTDPGFKVEYERRVKFHKDYVVIPAIEEGKPVPLRVLKSHHL